jgi:spore coat protein A, manganese oxidase
VFHGRVLATRLIRLLLAVVLAAGGIGYAAIRLGGSATPAAAATTPPTIKIPHNAQAFGFTTRKLTIKKGQVVRVVNNDSMRHTVTSNAKDSHGDPLFDKLVAGGARGTILATAKLAPGTYKYHCRFHPRMTGKLIVKGTGGGTTGSGQTFDLPLRVPRVITGANPVIPVKRAAVQVFAHGPKTMMWTYGGSYPGPTIRRPSGDATTVTFKDDLSAAGKLSVHLHGDHHRAVDDGQPDTDLLSAGHRRTYHYPLKDGGQPVPSAFFYYHDHRMLETGRNNWMGLQGMFIVDNPADAAYDLPTGKYDVPLLVSDRSFTSSNQLKVPFPKHPTMEVRGSAAPPGDATVGNTILVDGEYSPHFDVATHRYRLRLLNGSNFQSYDFELSDGESFTQIGAGDSLFPKPVVRKDILLGPSQRADVVVDFAGELGKRVVLESVPRVHRPKGGTGTPTAQLMQFRVTTQVTDTSHVPSTLLTLPAQPPLTVRGIAKTWTIDKTVGRNRMGSYWRINGKMFDPKRTDFTVHLNSTEKWKIVNNSSMTHYFHIHEEQWRTISRYHDHKPVPVPADELGLQDTWRLDPGDTVVVEGTFTDYTGTFMVHCHMLDHEDHGLMAQFKVVP